MGLRGWLTCALVSLGVALPQTWIEDNWEALRTRRLLDLTLPGSHNSGAGPDLSSTRLCASDYRYQDYLNSASPGQPSLSPDSFDSAFLPWNVNQDRGIADQLQAGIRWFHLKVCNFNPPNTWSLDQVFHQHCGYTSASSLQQTLVTFKSFLAQHPKEIVVIGFNNLHDNATAPPFPAAAASGLATAVQQELTSAGVSLIDSNSLHQLTLAQLVARNSRFLVFFAAPNNGLPAGVLDSSQALWENWDAAMEDGNLIASQAWLEADMLANAGASTLLPTRRFYVLQANPNDSEGSMFNRLRQNGPPTSLALWLSPFLRQEGSLITTTIARGQTQNLTLVLNAVSTDFPGASRPYEIAMELMGLPLEIPGEVQVNATNTACLNPAVAADQFESTSLDPGEFRLLSAYVLQRHMDRWVYAHPNIGNSCWPGQLNSSSRSSPLAAAECNLADGPLRTVWQSFPYAVDPFAAPSNGTCQVLDSTPQGTWQGIAHASRLGQMMLSRYVDQHALLDPGCPAGQVKLHADNVHKNELTVQVEYQSLCGRLPSLQEFPPNETLVGYIQTPQKGTPWYVTTGACGGTRLQQLSQRAEAAMLRSSWWNLSVQAVAGGVAAAAGHTAPEARDAAAFLDSVLDCTVVHACTGLNDAPAAFLTDGLPSTEPGSLFAMMNGNESQSRTWNFDYLHSIDPRGAFLEYGALFYGYFLTIIRDQLVAAANGIDRAPRLTVAVMSDSNISPLLALYGQTDLARQRPPYLSFLAHEVYLQHSTGQLFVRIIYNGQVVKLPRCWEHIGCPLSTWEDIIKTFKPSKDQCPVLYEAYEFIGPPLRSLSPMASIGDAGDNRSAWMAFAGAIMMVLFAAAMAFFWRFGRTDERLPPNRSIELSGAEARAASRVRDAEGDGGMELDFS